MRLPSRPPRRPRALAIALAAVALASAGAAPPRVPPLVFVSRQPVGGLPPSVPGLGPHLRAASPGGRLMVRDRSGHVRPLLDAGAMFDVSDPSVSPDGRWIAFAGKPRLADGWSIWRCRADGGGLRAVTAPRSRYAPPESRPRADDLDPCWISERELCFASTRDAQRSQYADVLVTQLYVVNADGTGLRPITSERNGADEPCYDRARDRIVYARWWFNRWRPSRRDSSGITADPSRAVPADTVNLWQAVEIARDGSGLRLAAGAVASRRATMAYQPAVLADGSLAGVYALNTGLSPSAGALGVQVFPGRYGTARRVVGAFLEDADETGYGTPRGLAAPTACSPAGLPDGRMIVSLDPGARGDLGLWVVRADGDGLERVVDLPGTHELDAAVLEPWPGRARDRSTDAASAGGERRGASAAPSDAPDAGGAGGPTFTYACANLFVTGPVDGGLGPPPPLDWPLRLRFFTTRGAGAERDTAVLLRVTDVADDGSVIQPGLPAGVPMFEQLVDASGQPLLTAHGAAHVAGANFGAPGGTSRCVGCHLGHSSLAAPTPPPATGDAGRGRATAPAAPAAASLGLPFDAAPIATLEASASAPGSTPAAAVDRRARGPAERVAWIAASDRAATLDLSWPRALLLESVRVALPESGPTARSAMAEIRVFRSDRPVATALRVSLRSGRPERRRLGGVRADRVEIRMLTTGGRHRAPLAIAEVEIPARFAGP